MALAPALILLAYYFIDQENTTALLTEPIGQLLLVIAAALDVVAYLWARIILNPDI
jgi:Flp pilus assembly protein TadB